MLLDHWRVCVGECLSKCPTGGKSLSYSFQSTIKHKSIGNQTLLVYDAFFFFLFFFPKPSCTSSWEVLLYCEHLPVGTLSSVATICALQLLTSLTGRFWVLSYFFQKSWQHKAQIIFLSSLKEPDKEEGCQNTF